MGELSDLNIIKMAKLGRVFIKFIIDMGRGSMQPPIGQLIKI